MRMGKLVVVLFHVIFDNSDEIHNNIIYPQQKITLQHFSRFIKDFLDHSYIFVSAKDLLNGLNPEINHVLITFDDGYYNNQRILPILKEFSVPALFFISTEHILQNKGFWWDIVYRERSNQGVHLDTIEKEIESLKKKRNAAIEKYILNNFGENAFVPSGDLDRPFSSDELQQFSRNEYVELGVHTSNHSILTNYERNEAYSAIAEGIKQLSSITQGRYAPVISYPNGNFSKSIINGSKLLGMKLGISMIQMSNYLPLQMNKYETMALGRNILWGDVDIAQQCVRMRSQKYFSQLKGILKRKILLSK